MPRPGLEVLYMPKEINSRIQRIKRIITRRPYTPMEIAQGALDDLNKVDSNKGAPFSFSMEAKQVNRGNIVYATVYDPRTGIPCGSEQATALEQSTVFIFIDRRGNPISKYPDYYYPFRSPSSSHNTPKARP